MSLQTELDAALDPETFEQWLSQGAAGDVVGRARCIGDCPLARYLGATLLAVVDVFGTAVQLYTRDQARERAWTDLTPLLVRFTGQVDHAGYREPITRGEALRALEAAR